MSTPPQVPLLEVEQIGEVTLVKFTSRKILEENVTRVIGEQLFSLVKEAGCRKLVLNFSKIERLTSVMLGKIVALHQKMEEAGGRMAICKIQRSVYEIFELLRLPKFLHIYEEEQQALQSF